jgi:hypothetical protein
MNSRTNGKATFAEVFGSIKFSGKTESTPAHPWPEAGFAQNKSTHLGQTSAEEDKLVRSCN